MYGFTKTTVRPAHAALTLTITVNVLHPASKIDLFNPVFALAPSRFYKDILVALIGSSKTTIRFMQVYRSYALSAVIRPLMYPRKNPRIFLRYLGRQTK